ncbi:MAG: M1 family metallopeptidase [Flavobacteriaceae bacterium]
MRYGFLLFCLVGLAQHPDPGYWQQEVDYIMDIRMDVDTYKYTGTQELVYTNHSPDTLTRVFYHLYFNAFQPGSQMDVRSRSIADPDGRVKDRISKLTPEEVGYMRVLDLVQDGKKVDFYEEETILVVDLAAPLLPLSSTVLEMEFEGQVPVQIRRSGRNNKEGVDLSMTQWYPKMAEYDREGWHPNPYIGREFHGVWGNFDVSITIDKDYVVGGTGYLQNASAIGHGYTDKEVVHESPTLTWRFVAPRVHDFAWAADPDYIHDVVAGPNDVELHFFYLNKPELKENWEKLQGDTVKMMEFFNENIGDYPYKQYSVLQGGDGGMEYAMCTLITGERSYNSLFGVTAHELAHSWFHHLLATNESKHAWVDEGFTSFYDQLAEYAIMGGKDEFLSGAYNNYFRLVASGLEEPLTTHADRYRHNFAYGVGSYSKGAIFLNQLGYIIGYDNLFTTIKRYYNEFKFTHPTPNDFKRVAEKVSGMQLEWYLNDWAQTTKTIDYGIDTVVSDGETTKVQLNRIGMMPMPVEVVVDFTNGNKEVFYIPLQMMRGEKVFKDKVVVLPDWGWASPNYEFTIDKPKGKIKSIRLNEEGLVADVDTTNDVFVVE